VKRGYVPLLGAAMRSTEKPSVVRTSGVPKVNVAVSGVLGGPAVS
jgi:hypothetical protein